MKRILLFILILSLVGCKYKNTEFNHQIVSIHNKSEKNIYYYYGKCDGGIDYFNPFNDPLFYIKANAKENKYDDSFEDIIESDSCDRLIFNFFDAEILATTPWDTVYHRKMILGTKSYTKDQLDSLGWKIEFP